VKDWPDGKRFKRKFPNKRKAEAMLTRIEASILDGTWPEFREKLKLKNRLRESVALAEFSETYTEDYAKVRNKKKAWKRKITSFRKLISRLGHLRLEEVSPTHLHKYIRERKRRGTSSATINRDLATIKYMMSYAVEIQVLQSNPIEKFKNLPEQQKERRRFTDDEIQAVIDAVRLDCRPLFVFVRETGCRGEEALSLKHWQVQENSRLVVFSEDTKSGKYRYVPLTDVALEAVNTLPRLEECPYVFYNLKTKDRWCDCRKPWEKARVEAGVPELQVKDLRRHYAIKLAENGADMHDIQQVLGHASVSTTEKHYAQFSPKYSAQRILRVIEGSRSKQLIRNSRSAGYRADDQNPRAELGAEPQSGWDPDETG
jgi:site-specific recombinase XerD